jgi:hypothetical protein
VPAVYFILGILKKAGCAAKLKGLARSHLDWTAGEAGRGRNLMAFLASGRAAAIHGTDIVIDGGTLPIA